jgi:prepilin-type N-terminal cleavage/methylation domain-containing protein
MRGYTLPELLVTVMLAATIMAIAVPAVNGALDAWRTRGAAFFMASRFALTRVQAVHRHANVGLRFTDEGDGFSMRPYADGNDNGVRSAEIASGVDRPIRDADRLDQLFPGTRFGFIENATLIDGTPAGPASDPIRFGSTNMVTFAPAGTATSGTVYLRGRGQVQYAVVVLGATGRTRIARFDAVTRQWSER